MSEIRIIPLGGVREVGKNMYLVEVNREIYVLDCGLMYPEGSQFGIDTVISDFSYIESNVDKLAGVFLTHGHEDAIGALPYFLDKFDVPVFGTSLTIELAKLAVKNVGIDVNYDDFHVIDEQTQIDFEQASVHFFKTTHTIPESVGVVIKTDEGNIVYTGDFKFDQSAHKDYQTDYLSIADIGREGVLALLSDSTNSESYAENESEIRVAEEVYEVFSRTDGRIIVSAVVSNILRIQQVFDAAYRSDRKIFLSGRQVEEVIEIALSQNLLIKKSDNLIQPIENLDKFDEKDVIILDASGPGESIKDLTNMAEGHHKQVKIQKDDLVFVVTSPSAAMEVQLAEMENKIYRAGGTMQTISDNIFATGHATPKELKLMMNLLRPEYFIPVQGDYSMLSGHAELAKEVGIPEENIFILTNGDVVTYEKEQFTVTGQVQTSNVMVDGSGVGDIGNIVLRDRRILSEDGVIIAVVTINRRKKTIVSGPQIVTRGFVFVKESTDLIDESTVIVKDSVEDVLNNQKFDWNTLKQEIRENLGKFLYKKTNRRPIVLPVIMEARK